MAYAAITYRVKPGHEQEIEKIFANSPRVSSPVIQDERGNEVGKLLGTAIFLKDDVLVRIIHFEGDGRAIGRYMAAQQNVHLLEKAMEPYLAYDRETSTVDGFADHFRNASMRCLAEFSLDSLPKA